MCVQNKALRASNTQLPIITINTNITNATFKSCTTFPVLKSVQCSIRESIP